MRRRLRKAFLRAQIIVAIRLFRFRQRAIVSTRPFRHYVSRSLATVIGTIVGALCLLSPTTTDLAAHLSEVNLTSALIIGSALALVLSLSIIPAQRAAEAFSPAILKIYARDRALLLVFVLLSGASLLSVLFGTGWTLGWSTGQTLFIQFLVLGISFDALRAFYLRTLALLNPQTAVTLVLNECDLTIARVRRTVERLARILRTESNPPEMQPVVRAQLFAASQIVSSLRGWIGQLDEFAHKALARKDTDAVNTIMTAMRAIGFRYVEARRTSLVLVPDFDNIILGGQSDLSKVLDPIHENLWAMCKQAAKGDNELVVRHCIQTLGAMTVYALTVIHNHSGLYRSAPLAYSPCFYLGRCAGIALGARMLDAVLAAIRSLGEILQKITRDVERSTVETQAIETLFHIAAASYGIQEAVFICFPAVQASLYAALHDIRIRGYRSQSTLDTVLRELLSLVPNEVAMEKAGQRLMKTFPPYSLGFDANIPALLADVANAVKPVDPERHWVSPFAEFLEASGDIVAHYRELTRIDFQDTQLRMWVVRSIISCAKVHIGLLDNPPPGSERFVGEVNDQLQDFIQAVVHFFPQRNPGSSHHASTATDGLAVLGMMLLEGDRLDSARACAVAIAAVAVSCLGPQAGAYVAADQYTNIEILARAADALGHRPAATGFRALIAKPPETDDTEWLVLFQEYLTRIGQLEDTLQRFDRGSALPDDPVQMLRTLLVRTRSPL
jgi:hypothetical protein